MKVLHGIFLVLSGALFIVFACRSKQAESEKVVKQAQTGAVSAAQPAAPAAPVDTLENGEPRHIQVQHVLVSFKGAGTRATRSRAEAQLLAIEVFSDARTGKDFGELVRQYSDDNYPGIYGLVNTGVGVPAGSHLVFRREQMVPAFGDVGFKLKVGEIGIANYNRKTSPYGWHIIKRLK